MSFKTQGWTTARESETYFTLNEGGLGSRQAGVLNEDSDA